MSIDIDAFDGCDKLKNVYISDMAAWEKISLSSYKSNPLCYGGNLYLNGEWVESFSTDLVLPEGITSIEPREFYGNDIITSVVIPEGVTSIGAQAFDGCAQLTSVVIPSTVTQIDSWAFSNCTNLKNIYISDLKAWCNIEFADSRSNPLSSGGNLYVNGELVRDLVIPEGVTSIKPCAFSGIGSIESIVIPEGVTEIGQGAFSNCKNLTRIEIPKSLKKIGVDAFDGDPYLNVYISDLKAWCEIEFEGATITGHSLVLEYHVNPTSNPLCWFGKLYLNGELVQHLVIPEGITKINGAAFTGCDSITSVEIPEGVTEIDDSAFLWCDKLESVKFPSSLNRIGKYALFACNNIKKIDFSGSLEQFLDIEIENNAYGFWLWAFDIDFYLNGEEILDVVIPEGITNMSSTNLSYFKIKSVKFLGEVESIGDGVFSGCDELESIEIPVSVKTIGNYAFNHCENLKTVYISDIGAWNAINFGNETSNPLYYGAELKLIVPEGTTSIPEHAYSDSTVLSSVEIPDGVTSIGAYAFSGCTNLTSITIPSSVKTIANSAFQGCNAQLTILCDGGSVAHKYAEENNISYQLLTSVFPGDIDGDGDLSMQDVLRLQKYLSGWDVEIALENCDVNADGEVNMQDTLRLLKYMSGWEVELGQS